MLQWFEEDLSKVDRCVTPWLFVVLHRPMYCIYPHRSNRIVAEHLREQLEFLLDRYFVDLVLVSLMQLAELLLICAVMSVAFLLDRCFVDLVLGREPHVPCSRCSRSQCFSISPATGST